MGTLRQEAQRENTLMRNVLLAFFVSGAASQPLGSFIPFLRESYGLSYDYTGVLLSCQSVGNLCSVVLAGLLPVYLGRRRSILCTAVWMALGYLIFASGFGNPLILALAFLMTGIARGGNSNFSGVMISTLPEPKATRGYNLLHGCFAVGALLSPLLLIAFTKRWPDYGWRFMATALLLLVVFQLLIYVRMPLPPEPTAKSIRTVDRSFLKIRQFWLASSILFFYISSEYAIVGWLVTYFQDIGVLNPNQSQMMNSLLWLVIFIGRMVGAAITGKVSRKSVLLSDGIGFFLFFLLVFFSRAPLPIMVGIIGVGFFMSTIYPTAFAFGSDYIKGNDIGSSAMIFTGSAGGIITPALVGFVAEQSGMRAGMGVVVILTALLLLSIVFSSLSMKKPGK